MNARDILQSGQALYRVSPEKSEANLEVFTGKSVLCSTAIHFALHRSRSDPETGVAFFYFTFNDKSKQDESAMVRALILQLSEQAQDDNDNLYELRNSCGTGVPPFPVLIAYLRRLIKTFSHVYIILDALDESPRDVSREQVLEALKTMRNWGLQCLHLLVTSRDERDIQESFNLSPAHQVIMQNTGIDKDIIRDFISGRLDPLSPAHRVIMQNRGIDKDIRDFISGRLDTDRRLKNLLPYRERVQESLAARAKGM